MKIMVCGPIVGAEIDRILEIREFLESMGFETVNSFPKVMIIPIYRILERKQYL